MSNTLTGGSKGRAGNTRRSTACPNNCSSVCTISLTLCPAPPPMLNIRVSPHIKRLRIERTVCKNGNHTLDSMGLLPLTVGIAQAQNPAWQAMLRLFDAQVVLNRQFGGAVGPHGHGGVGLTQRHILRPPVHRPTG